MNNVVSKHFTCALRIRISDKIQSVPIQYIDSTPNGEIISRMTDDVSVMGNTIHIFLETMISGFFQLIFISIVLLNNAFTLATSSIIPKGFET